MGKLIRIVIIIVLVTAAVGASAAWYLGRGDKAPEYRLAPVRRTEIVQAISATGTVVPEDVIDVGAQVNGPIASFGTGTDGKQVDYRSTVEQGSVLARIDDSIYAAEVASAQAQLEQARAQVRTAEATREQAVAKLDQAQRDWDRAQRLGPSAALARADYDAAQSNFEQARAGVGVADAAINQAHASVALAEANHSRAKRNLEYCTISSPVAGVIIDRRVEIGQTVVASFNAPSLFLIAKDLSRMQVLVQVNEADIGHVQPGQAVNFTVDAFPGRTFKGEVRKVRLNATMTQNVVTYTVEIVTDNSDLTLLPYLTANVRFVISRSKDVLAVPNAALRFSPRTAAPAAPAATGRPSRPGGRDAASPGAEAGPVVWVLDSAGQPRPLSVKTGISDGTLTEVSGEGLDANTQVVLGEQSAGAAAPAAGGAASPFTPQMRRR